MSASPARAGGVAADTAFAAGDYVTAYQQWQAAARSGDAVAMEAIGMLYDTGHGVAQDFAAAIVWYRWAAESGNVTAMFNLGAMYDSGRGTGADRTEAVRWYALAARHGNGRAAYNLGVIYRDGDGVPRDTQTAIHYFRQAEAAGIAASATSLAMLGQVPARPVAKPSPPPMAPQALSAILADIDRFQKNVLARGDLDRGAREAFAGLVPVLTSEAARGNRLAQYDLGYAFEHGIGVKADPVQAYVYFVHATVSEEPVIQKAALQGAVAVGSGLNDAERASAGDLLLNQAP